MAIKVVVVLLIALTVLAVLIYMTGMGKGSVDITMARSVMWQCCTDRAIYDCTDTSVLCNVPWSEDKESLQDLAERVGVTDIATFCLCE